jgi:hypothetical protein
MMAYSDFTLARVKQDLGIEVAEGVSLFPGVEPVKISDLLRQLLDRDGGLATLINTEKARSEFLIAPILADVRQQSKHQVSLFSGSSFNVDVEKGLIGFCDFILSQSPEQIDVTAPVVTVTYGRSETIVEAKNESVIGGLGQCIASMVAAQIFNQRSGIVREAIYGAVTSGTNWRFLKLVGNRAWVDDREYFINEVDQILGILLVPFRDGAIE